MLLRQLKEWDPIDPILSADTMYTEIICFYLFDPPSTDTRPAGGVGRRLAECSPLPDERTHRVFLQERFFYFSFRFSDSLFSPIFLFFRKSSDDERSSGGEGRRLSKILSFFSRWEFSKKILREFTFWFWLILNSYKNVYALLLFMTYSHNLLNIKAKSRANSKGG